MSDFVVDFDLFGGQNIDDWVDDQQNDQQDVVNPRHIAIDDNELDELERSRNETGTVKQTNWSVRVFESWCKQMTICHDFKTMTKQEFNQTLRRFMLQSGIPKVSRML